MSHTFGVKNLTRVLTKRIHQFASNDYDDLANLRTRFHAVMCVGSQRKRMEIVFRNRDTPHKCDLIS